MAVVALDDRTLVRVAGPDAEHLLQNIITTDLDRLGVGEAKPGALLTPQGKILFDFLVSRDGVDGFRLDVRRDVASDFQRRLMLYRLRAKAEISIEDQAVVTAAWESDSSGSEIDSTRLVDRRFEASVLRAYGSANANAAREDWDGLRVASGIAESGSDYALGDAFPHDVLLDQMDGIGMRKGCYIGQEVVSRMQHRGTARRRILIAEASGDLPGSGTDVVAGGKSVGTLGTVQGRRALAIVRIDRVKDALDARTPITAGGVQISLSIPQWAGFTFPEASEAEQA